MRWSFLAFATRISYPHSSRRRLTHGEWVPTSMATVSGSFRIEPAPDGLRGGAHSALLDDLSTLVVQEAEIAVLVPKVCPRRHLQLSFATITHRSILLPY